jgi:hypothetical protein
MEVMRRAGTKLLGVSRVSPVREDARAARRLFGASSPKRSLDGRPRPRWAREHYRCGNVRFTANRSEQFPEQPPLRQQQTTRIIEMGGILLWLIGIPIPLIILLYFIF